MLVLPSRYAIAGNASVKPLSERGFALIMSAPDEIGIFVIEDHISLKSSGWRFSYTSQLEAVAWREFLNDAQMLNASMQERLLLVLMCAARLADAKRQGTAKVVEVKDPDARPTHDVVTIITRQHGLGGDVEEVLHYTYTPLGGSVAVLKVNSGLSYAGDMAHAVMSVLGPLVAINTQHAETWDHLMSAIEFREE